MATSTIAASDLYPTFLLALCAWREARGESAMAQLGVIWSVLNRAARPSWWGRDIVSVILQPFQYSSFNANDPNATKFPLPGDTAWTGILAAAIVPGEDPTGGATHYYDDSIPAPSWAAAMTPAVKLGRLNFYR